MSRQTLDPRGREHVCMHGACHVAWGLPASHGKRYGTRASSAAGAVAMVPPGALLCGEPCALVVARAERHAHLDPDRGGHRVPKTT